MFAGIVEEAGRVDRVEGSDELIRLTVSSSLDQTNTSIGDSISVDGVCLTVVEKKGNFLTFELSSETIRRSTLGTLNKGDLVNLERSLKFGDRISGHFVMGHVDTTVKLLERRKDGECDRFLWDISSDYLPYLAPKGSVSIAGISLTVGEVECGSFSVYIIPHTLKMTKLGTVKIGDRVNLEVDVFARYVRSALDAIMSNKKI